MSNRSIHYRRASLGEGTTAACGTITSSMTSDPAEVTCKRCLKTIETGSAESGYLAGSELNKEHQMSDKKAELIAQMLAKAERTTPEEAEALMAAAAKLMAKHMIDQATIDAKRNKAGQPTEKIVTKKVFFKGAYRLEWLSLGHNVARGMGTVKTLQSTYSNTEATLWVIGFESDVDQAIQLVNSLRVQAQVAVKQFWSGVASGYQGYSRYDQEAVRRSFAEGFGRGAGDRIWDNRQTVIEESGAGTELMLVDRTIKVEAYVDSMTKGKSRARGGKGSWEARAAGKEAGRNAATGEKGLTGGRGIGA